MTRALFNPITISSFRSPQSRPDTSPLPRPDVAATAGPSSHTTPNVVVSSEFGRACTAFVTILRLRERT